MKVYQFARPSIGMLLGIKVHRYKDGHGAILMYDPDHPNRTLERPLNAFEVQELIEVLSGDPIREVDV